MMRVQWYYCYHFDIVVFIGNVCLLACHPSKIICVQFSSSGAMLIS